MTILDGSYTAEQFIQHETSLWGVDEVESLLDRGYAPYFDTNRNKWTWLLSQTNQGSLLTPARPGATLGGAGRSRVYPFTQVR